MRHVIAAEIQKKYFLLKKFPDIKVGIKLLLLAVGIAQHPEN